MGKIKGWKKTLVQSNFIRYHNSLTSNYFEISKLNNGLWEIQLRKDNSDGDVIKEVTFYSNIKTKELAKKTTLKLMRANEVL